jgi:phospholipase/carboxylesterase
VGRRSILVLAAVGAVLLPVCRRAEVGGEPTASPLPSPSATVAYEEGRLAARPDPTVAEPGPTGLREFPAAGPGSLLFVPPSYRPGRPAPFALTLHGCCGEARSGLNLWFQQARDAGVILLAPDGGGAWGFGDTAERIDRGLQEVFVRYAVDPDHVAVVGFSAGASFALSLGLINGDLFTHVVSHSPGGYIAGEATGEPEVFVIHGVDDQTIPIEVSRDLVPELKREGYRVRYEEYPAGHRPQPGLMAEAVAWFLR